jgi:hypothetical protein
VTRSRTSLLQREFAVHDYIAWSTVATVFLRQKLFHAGVDFYVGYPVMMLNMALLLSAGLLVVHRAQLAILAVIGGVTLLAAMLAGTPPAAPILQLIGITGMSVYYLSALSSQRLDLYRIMDIYAAFSLAVLASVIPEYFIGILRHTGLRPHSIFEEPSHLVFATLPALAYYFFRFVENRSHKLELAIMTVGYLLVDSSLGFMGIMVMLVMAFGRRLSILRIIAMSLVVGILAGGLFLTSANLRLRVLGTFTAASTGNVESSNLSTFSLLTNAYVSYRSFLEHPLVGVGLGGHPYVYDRYVTQIVSEDNEYYGENITDANSMLLRLISEAGLSGIVALVAFFAFFHRAIGKKYRFLQSCFVPYFVVRIARDGTYFSFDLDFFLAMYTLCFLESRIMAYPHALKTGPIAA